MNQNERCKNLVIAIDKISQNETEEIFKMIHTYGCPYTKNNNGLFINLTWIPNDLLDKLEQYVKFCTCSQTELKKYESICDVLNHKLKETTNENKIEQEVVNKELNNLVINNYVDELDENEVFCNDENENDNEKEVDVENEKTVSKVSSSMKFSLLKKRYSKLSIMNTNIIENDLKIEKYIIV